MLNHWVYLLFCWTFMYAWSKLLAFKQSFKSLISNYCISHFTLCLVFMPPPCKIRASLVLQNDCHLESFSWLTGCPALLGFSGACFGVFSRLAFFIFACGLFMCVHQLFIFLAFVFIFPSYILLSCASWFIRLKWRLRLSKNRRVYPVREARCSTAM